MHYLRQQHKLHGQYNPAKEEMANGGNGFNGPPMPLQPMHKDERLI
jgi:hypothetical protein